VPTYNFKDRELTAKIVYYGPGMCGKTTNLQVVHDKMREEMRGKLVSIATESDRTIYFDLLPMSLGKIAGMTFTVRVFTVPGQIYYSETRRLVLQGADGVVFVADSGKDKLAENIESLKDLKKNLAANKLDYDTIPFVLQWNKRDLPEVLPTTALDRALNDRGAKALEAVAFKGDGVLETLRAITVEVYNNLKAGLKSGAAARAAGASGQGAPAAKAAAPPSAASAAPPAGAAKPAPPSPGKPAAKRPAAQAAAAPVGHSAATPLDDLNADDPEALKKQIAFAEFQNIAVLHHKLTERVALLEKEVFRLRRDLKQVAAGKVKVAPKKPA
jgi:mutual gliding-motility protein MglA